MTHNPNGFCRVPYWLIETGVFATLPPSAALVYLTLLLHADEHGRCWPSYKTLRRLSGLSDRTINTMVWQLDRAGVLHIHERPGTSNEYWIVVNRSMWEMNQEGLAEMAMHPR